jgi:hypothetical protein
LKRERLRRIIINLIKEKIAPKQKVTYRTIKDYLTKKTMNAHRIPSDQVTNKLLLDAVDIAINELDIEEQEKERQAHIKRKSLAGRNPIWQDFMTATDHRFLFSLYDVTGLSPDKAVAQRLRWMEMRQIYEDQNRQLVKAFLRGDGDPPFNWQSRSRIPIPAEDKP